MTIISITKRAIDIPLYVKGKKKKKKKKKKKE